MLARCAALRATIHQQPIHLATRAFCASATTLEKALPPRRKITDDEISESFLRGTGPGGQKINKTSCAVQLKHHATGIVVKSQHTRSREQNRKFARLLLGEKLDELEKGGDSRNAIKAERASKKKASAMKKTKRKYKKLAEGKSAVDEGEGDAVEEEVQEDIEEVNDVLSGSTEDKESKQSDKGP